MFIETKDMLRPKIYVINKRKVYDVDYVNFDDKSYGVTEEDGLCEEYTFNDVTLMLNTGVKDVDNKDIYVNDIVEFAYSLFPDYIKGIVNSDNQVVVNNVMYLDIKDLLAVKVVGNIFENKELLGA